MWLWNPHEEEWSVSIQACSWVNITELKSENNHQQSPIHLSGPDSSFPWQMFNFLLWSDFSLEGESCNNKSKRWHFCLSCAISGRWTGASATQLLLLEPFSSRLVHVYTDTFLSSPTGYQDWEALLSNIQKRFLKEPFCLRREIILILKLFCIQINTEMYCDDGQKKKDPLGCPKVYVGASFLTHMTSCVLLPLSTARIVLDHKALKFKQLTSKISSGISCTLNPPYQGIPFM